ncbi:unnamed protein product [Ilex paraguariensis]|uniref:Uncharacterized protein n=1 Tax=Ilex paraguariensis TaxID=185542 RepID=A0ABC8R622_9AQUA
MRAHLVTFMDPLSQDDNGSLKGLISAFVFNPQLDGPMNGGRFITRGACNKIFSNQKACSTAKTSPVKEPSRHLDEHQWRASGASVHDFR